MVVDTEWHVYKLWYYDSRYRKTLLLIDQMQNEVDKNDNRLTKCCYKSKDAERNFENDQLKHTTEKIVWTFSILFSYILSPNSFWNSVSCHFILNFQKKILQLKTHRFLETQLRI